MNYGDLGVVLAVGALFYIGYQTATQPSAIIGAVAKDPCTGLTGATLTACRKTHPIKAPVKKPLLIPSRFQNVKRPIRPAVYGGAPITPSTRPGSISQKKINSASDIIARKEAEKPKVNTAREFAADCELFGKKLLEQLHRNGNNMKQAWTTIQIQNPGIDWNSASIKATLMNCAEKYAREHYSQVEADKQQQARAPGYKLDSTSDKYSINKSFEEETKIQHKTPIDHFVNGIGEWLQQAWTNLTQGRTAIGGQPVFPGGRGVVRPMVVPLV